MPEGKITGGDHSHHKDGKSVCKVQAIRSILEGEGAIGKKAVRFLPEDLQSNRKTECGSHF